MLYIFIQEDGDISTTPDRPTPVDLHSCRTGALTILRSGSGDDTSVVYVQQYDALSGEWEECNPSQLGTDPNKNKYHYSP